ncbi:MAG: ATP-dependent DNA helicase RecG [Candidatus Pacebacteria bacterium]|jgi:ATP-dependent DNA helicase RecG|nr:ATP-dependent DNA helicase RecG [Parcubacteria group bacterium]MDP6249430.1 ATP-dependent DNA helicase RecG [Candidatus Paceibacterota bacterium]MDP7159588.1 ATP-dependent DNA helicase RecG [Candidatus Paceibacterota bacterium]MDP7366307.1 ATP-dependent DNA helicase RecG [Candidatus Paceibacterota bacterium]MDP7466196.1 ATP-dependent DNA helicase RecG [Candidatus Paceibacterota bacterium]|tara:strand:+ start:11927 stop:14083 length:2157 start_codon:yes stop_codon:yes gene_type:complete
MQPNNPLENHFRLAQSQKSALKKLGILTIRDLLFHFPSRYENITGSLPISSLKKDDDTIIYGKLSGLKTRKSFKSRRPIAEGYIEDNTGKIKIIWFNQPYIAKMLRNGALVKLSGKVTGDTKNLYIANPEAESLENLPINIGESLFSNSKNINTFLPVYPESRGITSKWFYHNIQKIFASGLLDTMQDAIPNEILKKYNLPTLKTALIWIHTPKTQADSQSARKRFAFAEVFFIQISKQRDRKEYEKKKSFSIKTDKKDVKEFMERFPFSATKSQNEAIESILKDFEGKHAMSRLLEGDVGSGKTAVAATVVHAVTTTRPEGQDFGNLQTAYMVPTEILAKQHFETFIQYFSHLPIKIGLITSSGCKKFPSKVSSDGATNISRTQLLKWVANGEIPILIGTHSLIQKTVNFENLAFIIIDEQHRFGTAQRQKLTRKDDIAPHLLSMTATPIPRTLALTIYGDLDLTVLDEMPKGRKPIITEIVTPKGRDKIYEKVCEELKSGRQAYVITPRIDEPDLTKEKAINAKSVKEEAKRLKKDIFPEYEIEILHSKMKASEKEEVMERFTKNKTQILVATSVVEVGVNVPNATVIIIEGAERFGLAQLHQLRGRVIRSNHQAYAYVFSDSRTAKTNERLKALKSAKNGFELAEFDLGIRGSGELYGKRQSGLSDIAMEAMKNIKMVEAAREEAKEIVEKDNNLEKYPEIMEIIKRRTKDIHFE